ncbi:hypothetical protein [Pseudomonas fluorescens]|uniref:Capsule polysaccharide biosynthesis protein n=1 Tax=Pseudomonas fluorescens TaxID=294 RepID=A0A5E7D4P6_PSEFL|nr:hypothetical protein [Pseudomonas fluorescens]VVO11996.1 hypothetical protein PS691_03481 [Pseudomonas fluorescens]
MEAMQNLIMSPGNLFRAVFKATKKNITGTPTYVVGFSTWKQYLRKYFPQRNLHFLAKNISKQEFESVWRKKILSQSKSEIFIWGLKAPDFILNFAKENDKKIFFVEDGFVRSVGLGAQKTPPMSLTMDSKTPYFDAREASDLELLLGSYNFSADTALMKRADSAIQQLLANGISKYNNSEKIDIEKFYGTKKQKRILVIGQVEDDASIQLGCNTKLCNNDLVRIAAKENPGAQILYKPHPDILSGNRPLQSNPGDVKSICSIIESDIPLSQSFHLVDHVYTITSLAGFEALLRGIKVTTLGCPFYSGWGLTDDRQANPRRTRTLKANELFAGAYILYAKYFDVDNGGSSALESVMDKISEEATSARKVGDNTLTSALLTLSNSNVRTPLAIASPTKKKPTVPTVKPAVKPAVKPPTNETLPTWFNSRPGIELKTAITDGKPVFLYIPWIAGHGDTLVEKLTNKESYNLAPLDFIIGLDTPGVRQDVLKFTRSNPALYRKMLINRIVPLRRHIAGVIFTFDWSPVMRLVASICEELQIPRVLIPHESVFVDREKYYWDITSKASTPVADIVLGWGGMQKEIFTERGYPVEHFRSVGAPKFDTHKNYQAQLTREQFCRLFGLQPKMKIILFASQPLDSQLDKKTALTSQRLAINDLLDAAALNNAQLLVRLPPNKEDILGASLRSIINNSSTSSIDDGKCYLVSPEEAIYHADIITSINSTMLFEGLLMGRPALSLKYVHFDQVWEHAGIPAANNASELNAQLPSMLLGEWSPSSEGMAWAAQMFGVGEFDGKASERIRAELATIASNNKTVALRPSALERLFNKQPIDVMAIPSSATAIRATQRYMQAMLQARTCVLTVGPQFNKQEATSVDIFFQWGITETTGKKNQRALAKELGRPIVYIEDGFIRSLDIGLSKEPGLSIILDDTTAYYDATRISRLQRLLESGPVLSEDQLTRSRKAIEKIVENRVSKYNHAPDVKLNIGVPGRKKILVIDQRYGDQSVASGLGSDMAFDQMLRDVFRNHADCDIIIKQHPDAIKGGKSSYFSNEKLAFSHYMDNVHPILFDVNPFSLFDLVDEVYAMTSGMGFEALMAGKTVHCYGVPFYAGWGQTQDQQSVSSRTRVRSLEEIFHFAYIESSRYFHPVRNEVVEVEDVVDYIVSLRDFRN